MSTAAAPNGLVFLAVRLATPKIAEDDRADEHHPDSPTKVRNTIDLCHVGIRRTGDHKHDGPQSLDRGAFSHIYMGDRSVAKPLSGRAWMTLICQSLNTT